MVKSQRGCQVEARTWHYHRFSDGMRVGESRYKVHSGSGRARIANCGNGNRLSWRAEDHLVTHSEPVHAANCDFGGAGACVRQESRAGRCVPMRVTVTVSIP